MLAAIILPFAGSVNDSAYCTLTSISGFTDFTPAIKPDSNFSINGDAILPTNPTLFVFVLLAAATPTKNDPWCSLNVILVAFGASTTSSTIAKLVSGNWPAAV